MATNLRLRPDAEEALRTESVRVGRSQQELIREAIDSYLRVVAGPGGDLGSLMAAGLVRAPRSELRAPARRIMLPEGMTSADLLDRDDRF